MSKQEQKQDTNQSGPVVLAVFRADCRATKGLGSTVAVVQGGSGKCRLYGKDSLANAFPDIGPVCRTLINAGRMAEHFKVAIVVGKAACDRFMAEHKLSYDGREEVVADAGKSPSKRKGGFKQIDYAIFTLALLLPSCHILRF
ncbi:hypothetical protein LCGC14_2680710 [marine sediment metagenome]|uniref:Uncharacterized protein n=1 Tax=marine sediment metagenome TaxID=412755 RepID=A0A0F8ZLE3_9ZZZZ